MTRRPPFPQVTATATPLLLALAAALVLVPATGALGPAPSSSPTDTDAPGVTEAPWGPWLATTVDGDSASGETDIAFTTDGRPFILYKWSPPTNAHIRVVHRTGMGEWTGHTFDVSGRGGSLVLDGGDQPHVAFQRGFGPGTDLFYAHRTSDGGWTKTIVDSSEEDSLGSHPSIDLNDSDQPRISYHKDGDLHYAWRTMSGWKTQMVAEGGYSHELDFGPDDTPHIAYRTGADIYHAKKVDGTWQTELAQPSCVFEVSIAVDTGGTPHIACRIDSQGMAHIHKTSNGWSSTIVDDGSHAPLPRDPDKLAMPSIALDDEGVPRIGYAYEPNLASPRLGPGQPHYAEKVDGEWAVETVDRDGQDNGRGMSLALDSDGRPFLSYIRENRYEDGGGFPGSGQVDSMFDLRLARPGQAEALGLAGS